MWVDKKTDTEYIFSFYFTLYYTEETVSLNEWSISLIYGQRKIC